MDKLIYAYVYDPTGFSLFKKSKNEKAALTKIYCSNSENCDVYCNKNQCIKLNMFNSGCPYGKKTKEYGYTRRARKFYSWMSERKEKYKGLTDLNRASQVMAFVGEYVYLPYSHMSFENKKVEFLQNSHLFSSGMPFIKREDFTEELIIHLVNHRPYAMMGGEIRSYQKEEVPKFLNHLREIDPTFFNSLFYAHEVVKEKIRDYTNVGRNAYIHSLRPGTKIYKVMSRYTDEWIWNGEYLTSTNASFSFPIVSYDKIEVNIRPKKDETIKVSSDDQVDSDTKYKD